MGITAGGGKRKENLLGNKVKEGEGTGGHPRGHSPSPPLLCFWVSLLQARGQKPPISFQERGGLTSTRLLYRSPFPLGQVEGGVKPPSASFPSLQITLGPIQRPKPMQLLNPPTTPPPHPFTPPLLLFLAPAASCKHPVLQTNIQTGSAADFDAGKIPAAHTAHWVTFPSVGVWQAQGEEVLGPAALEEM